MIEADGSNVDTSGSVAARLPFATKSSPLDNDPVYNHEFLFNFEIRNNAKMTDFDLLSLLT